MCVTFIENERAEISQVITTLETTDYFTIHELQDYDAITDDIIRQSDLFVLDVLTAGNDEGFCRFIGVLRKHTKPFLAFTRITEHGRLKAFAGEPELRQAVFEHGGIGAVSKVASPGDESRVRRRDMQFELIERINNFYWSRQP
jgi:hypothetical protein